MYIQYKNIDLTNKTSTKLFHHLILLVEIPKFLEQLNCIDAIRVDKID